MGVVNGVRMLPTMLGSDVAYSIIYPLWLVGFLSCGWWGLPFPTTLHATLSPTLLNDNHNSGDGASYWIVDSTVWLFNCSLEYTYLQSTIKLWPQSSRSKTLKRALRITQSLLPSRPHQTCTWCNNHSLCCRALSEELTTIKSGQISKPRSPFTCFARLTAIPIRSS